MKRALLAAASVFATGAMWSCCIARGARVRTPGGGRLIEELGVGDAVRCFDLERAEVVETRVTAVRRSRRECVALEHAGGSLLCTSDHPLYAPDAKAWAPAGDWALGKRSQLFVGERAVHVTRAVPFVGVHEVFDVSVEHEAHNFFANDVLVHNKSPVKRVIDCDVSGPLGVVRSTNWSECDCGFQTSVSHCEPNPDGGPRWIGTCLCMCMDSSMGMYVEHGAPCPDGGLGQCPADGGFGTCTPR